MSFKTKNVAFGGIDSAEDLMTKLTEFARENAGRYISPKKLRLLYRGFSRWQKLFISCSKWMKKEEIKRLLTFECDLIHYLLERFFWIRYGDSEIVADLLKKLCLIDGHLGKIFIFQQLSISSRKRRIDPETCSYYLGSTWNDETLSKEEIQPVHYFMEHANRKKILFNGKRLAEQYFMQCINRFQRHAYDILFLPPCSLTFRIPEILLTLLQYGLFADSGYNDGNIGRLLTGIIGIILVCDLDYGRLTPFALRMIKVGNVLLRAVGRVKVSTLLKGQKVEYRRAALYLLEQQICQPCYLPKLKTRCTGLQELQHLCRRTIRFSLYNSWKLPCGSELLPLPKRLIEYINLQHD